MRSAINLSKYIINKCIDEDCPISNLQLQKILYYIQKEFLKFDNIAFYDVIEAWRFGPVVPDVYYCFCGAGSMPISTHYNDVDMHDYTPFELEDIDEIVNSKRILSPWTMVEETHKEGGAWDLVFKKGSGNKKEIPIDLIKKVG